MLRSSLKTICIGLTFAASAATADPATDGVVSLLQQQGFSEIRIGRTFLGRVRIVATSDKSQREIVLNPRTGEILRDFWTAEDEAGNRSSALIAIGAAKNSPTSDDSENDDEGDDNESADDNGGEDSDESDGNNSGDDGSDDGDEGDSSDDGDDGSDDGDEGDGGDSGDDGDGGSDDGGDDGDESDD